MTDEPERKLRIFANTNAKMSRGKYAAQAVHAALLAVGAHPGVPVVVLGAGREQIEKLPLVVRDAGLTEVEPGTVTAGTDWTQEMTDDIDNLTEEVFGVRFHTRFGNSWVVMTDQFKRPYTLRTAQLQVERTSRLISDNPDQSLSAVEVVHTLQRPWQPISAAFKPLELGDQVRYKNQPRMGTVWSIGKENGGNTIISVRFGKFDRPMMAMRKNLRPWVEETEDRQPLLPED